MAADIRQFPEHAATKPTVAGPPAWDARRQADLIDRAVAQLRMMTPHDIELVMAVARVLTLPSAARPDSTSTNRQGMVLVDRGLEWKDRFLTEGWTE